MIFVASLIITLFAIWLIAISLFALVQPVRAVKAIGAFASTNFIHYLELGLRALVGISFIVVASVSPAPRIFTLIGWGLLVSALVIAALPRRWHALYAQYCSKRMPARLAYVFAPISLVAGVYLAVRFAPLLLR